MALIKCPVDREQDDQEYKYAEQLYAEYNLKVKEFLELNVGKINWEEFRLEPFQDAVLEGKSDACVKKFYELHTKAQADSAENEILIFGKRYYDYPEETRQQVENDYDELNNGKFIELYSLYSLCRISEDELNNQVAEQTHQLLDDKSPEYIALYEYVQQDNLDVSEESRNFAEEQRKAFEERKHNTFMQPGEQAQSLIAKIEEQTQSLITKHVRTISLKKDQSLVTDDYGNCFFDKWIQAREYFIENVLLRDLLISEYLLEPKIGTYEYRNRAQKFIDDAVEEYKRNQLETNQHLSIDVSSISPTDFEHYCADILRHNGWNARVTQAGADQGIDVIATYQNIKAVLQCKKYSQPVGNASVQEIIAGKHYEQADIACVVSNNTYTPSAKQLASSTGVYLLHYTELNQLAEKIGLGGE